MSITALKIVAMITMLIDHIGAFLVNSAKYPELYSCMRTVGRISFPIFCFMLVQGFIHTRNIYKYLVRILIFAFISEIPFDLASTLNVYSPEHQNVFFTLFLGLLAVSIIDRYNTNIFAQIMTVIVTGLIAVYLCTDYIVFGVFQIVIFYFLRNNRLLRIITIALLNLYMGQIAGAFSLVFIEQYNGKHGMNIKYFAYAFYPLHLIAIWLLRVYCF